MQTGTGESWLSRARLWAAISTSGVALVFSGYSFYETVWKQPELRFYPPPKIYIGGRNDVQSFAIPVTISNDGARSGTVLSFDLEVTHRETGKTMKFKSLEFGESPKAARLFTPMTIPGRSSSTEVVLFYANKAYDSLVTKDLGDIVGKDGIRRRVRLPLRFTLQMNVDTAGGWIRQPTPVVLDKTANFRGDGGLYDPLWADETLPPLPIEDSVALKAYQKSIFPAQQAAIHKAAGFEVPIDVRWDAIAAPDEGESYSDENYWTNIFFVPLAQALSEVTSDSAAKQAVRDKLKKIVVTYDKETAPALAYEKGVKFEDGVLTLNFRPFSNTSDVAPRMQAIRKKLEAKL
jgi:hypothetical protein